MDIICIMLSHWCIIISHFFQSNTWPYIYSIWTVTGWNYVDMNIAKDLCPISFFSI